jgi:hypothetical protein
MHRKDGRPMTRFNSVLFPISYWVRENEIRFQAIR